MLRRIGGQSGHRKHGADVHVQLADGDLVDGDLPRRVRGRQAPGEQPRDLEGAAEVPVKRCEHRGGGVERAVGAGRLRVDPDHRGRGRDAVERAERRVVAGHAGPGGGHQRVGGPRDGEEPGVGGVGPDRAGRRDKDGAAGDRDQQRERGPAAPARAELVRGEQDRRAHAAAQVTRHAGKR
jgi:hypothetical protein